MLKSSRNGEYSCDFRQRAIALAEEIGVTSAAEKLGVGRERLKKWVVRDAKGLLMRNKNKRPTPESRAAAQAEAELKRLSKENEELKKANWVLKEIAKVFSKDQLEPDLKRSLNSPVKGPKK